MNINFIDGMIMPVITTACLCIGFVLKKWMPADDKWIPTILFFVGALSGLILFGVDYEGVVKGMVSGLAAVGLHQAFKQHIEAESKQDSFNDDTEMFDDAEVYEVEEDEDTEDTAFEE